MEEIGFWEGINGSYFILVHNMEDDSVSILKVESDGVTTSIIPMNLFLYSKLKYHSDLNLE